MKIEEALIKLGRKYTYDCSAGRYEGISCCDRTIEFENFLGVLDVGKCECCGKSFTRKALLDDECFITYG